MTFMSIDDVQDVHVDSYLSLDGQLAFLSCFGTDTFIQELLAKMSTSKDQGGFGGSTMTFYGQGGSAHPVGLAKDHDLERRSTCMPPQSVFSTRLVHLQLFDPVLIRPDKAARRAALIRRNAGEEAWSADQLWTLVRETMPLPLLDEWQADLIDAFWRQGWLREHPGFNVEGIILSLAEVPIDEWMTAWLQQRSAADSYASAVSVLSSSASPRH